VRKTEWLSLNDLRKLNWPWHYFPHWTLFAMSPVKLAVRPRRQHALLGKRARQAFATSFEGDTRRGNGTHPSDGQKLKTKFNPITSAFDTDLAPPGLTMYCRLGCTSRPGLTVHPYVHSNVISQSCTLTLGLVRA